MGTGKISLGLVIALALVLSFSYAYSPQSSSNASLTAFSDNATSHMIHFPVGGGSDASAKIVLPRSSRVTGSSVRLDGIPLVTEVAKAADAVLVTDVSTSMSREGKLDEAKKSTKMFVDMAIYPLTPNRIGLVSYSTTVSSYMKLSNNSAGLIAEINSYNVVERTCISCGISRATELLAGSTGRKKVMIVHSDGKANVAIGGSDIHNPINSNAKAEAIAKASEAWSTYNITVYAIAYGSGADNSTMQQIAAAGNGSYYYSALNNLTQVYTTILKDIFDEYPSDVSLDIGGTSVADWSHPGELNSSATISGFNSKLNSLIGTCSSSQCTIDFKLSSSSSGILRLDNLNVLYELDEDMDKDGLPNYWENQYNQTGNLLDPYMKDTDSDGIADGTEDPDNDDLTNYEEYVHGTDPNNADTDGDGLKDGDEIAKGTDPNKPDTDNDTVKDSLDNCPLMSNPDQKDNDHDNIGDVCDPDDDNDGISDNTDNCPAIKNADQKDTDNDGRGDACDPDDDNDNISDSTDNCPLISNADQKDTDNDKIGDACDSDDDNDSILDAVDNCRMASNMDQKDTDKDGVGDACDPDDDNDNISDSTDNCPLITNADQKDTDNDGKGDACDPDDDNDNISDSTDNCPLISNADQKDTDNDKIGDACDSDDDNDQIPDITDNCPFLSNPTQSNYDNDTMGDACDPDDDNDGLPDGNETEIGTDPKNPDTDGDGISDGDEVNNGTNPLNPYDPDRIPPLPPKNLTAIAITPSEIRLSWVSSASEDVSSYSIYRSNSATFNFSRKLSSVTSLTNMFNDTGLLSGTTYYYVVRAKDRASNEENNTAFVFRKTYLTEVNPDPDGDGLPTDWENKYNRTDNLLDPGRNDTDNDGILDGDEDPDNDGLANYEEYLRGTDPNNPDTDGDGMPDGWEADHGLNPLDPKDGDKDNDGDGLPNDSEYNSGTDPNNPDTDGDGISDKNDPAPLNPNIPVKPTPGSGGTTVGVRNAPTAETITLALNSTAKVEISTINIPGTMFVGEPAAIEVMIKNTGDRQYYVEMTTYILGSSYPFSSDVGAQESYTASFYVTPQASDIGENSAAFAIKADGKVLERKASFLVEERPAPEEEEGELTIISPIITVDSSGNFVTVEGCLLEKRDRLSTYIDGILVMDIVPYEDNCFKKVIPVRLEPGIHALKITSGRKSYFTIFEVREKDKTAETRSPTPTGSLIERYMTPQNLFMAVVLLIIILIIAKRKYLMEKLGLSKKPETTDSVQDMEKSKETLKETGTATEAVQKPEENVYEHVVKETEQHPQSSAQEDTEKPKTKKKSKKSRKK